MKIALLSPFADISSIGIRSISAYLKAHGFSTRLVFLPLQKNFFSREPFVLYSDTVVDQLADLVRSDDLIGISLMSNFFDTVKDLTLRLKKRLPHKKIIWGGVHPTVMPAQCIEYADYVCIGEGEVPCCDLCRCIADGQPTDTIPGIWSRDDGRISQNPPQNIIIDLDQIPPLDYDLKDNFILIKKKRITELSACNMPANMGVTYWTMYSRGCPFSCSYCCNDAFRSIHKDLARLRCKSPQAMVDEILAILKKFPYVRYINFQDDTFFALSEEDIERFAVCYREHIDIPFLIPGINPNVFTERKFDCLVKSGLLRVRMGIQSGSKRIVQEVYMRHQNNDKIVEISQKLQKYSHKLTMPNYDIIVDCPWESQEDVLQTIALLDRLAPPFSLNIFSLQFFPGTRLYARAVKEGLFSEGSPFKPYYEYQRTYINLIIMLYALMKVPKWLLKLLLSKPLLSTNRTFERLHNILYNLILYRRGICSLIRRDYSMFPQSLQFLFCKMLPPPKNRT